MNRSSVGVTFGTKIIIYFCLAIGFIISVFPFYWLGLMSTLPSSAAYRFPPVLWPGSQFWTNFMHVLQNMPFFRSMLNSLYVAVISTILVMFFSSLAGYAFAKMEFKGRRYLFSFILVTMMVPGQLSLIPLFIIMTKIGWVGSLNALVVPTIANAFGIFWMKQYADKAVPMELISSAKLDGCSEFRVYWNIALPLLLPGLAALGIFTFMGSWNDYLWPLIVLNNESHFTIQVALGMLVGAHATDYGMLLNGTFLATAPLIIVFLIFNKLFISGLTSGAFKG